MASKDAAAEFEKNALSCSTWDNSTVSGPHPLRRYHFRVFDVSPRKGISIHGVGNSRSDIHGGKYSW